MNKIGRKLTAAGLCAVVCLTGVGAAFAQTTEQAEAAPQTAERPASADARQALCKDETVYVLAGADGSVQKIIVSDWIQNSLKSDTVSDSSALTDIETVKGDESYASTAAT